MRSEKSKPAAITISGFSLVGRWPKVALIDLLRRPTLSNGAFKFRFGRDASFPAVVVIRHQYPTLIGPARLGRLEHKEDFTADRHRRTAEGGPKAYVSIYPAWMLQHFWRPLGAKPRTLP